MPYDNKTFNRYFKVLDKIETAPKYKTVRELRLMLEEHGDRVTDRTVQRILSYFQARFKLVSRDAPDARGRPPKEFAWSREDGPPRFGTPDVSTALTLQLAADLLAPVLPRSYLDSIENDLKRARCVLGQINNPARKLPGKVRILPRGRGRMPANVDPKLLHTVFDALLEERRIRVTYVSGYNQRQAYATHELSPLGLVVRFDTLYLVHVREPRTDRENRDLVMEWPLHRFTAVEPLSTGIRVPAGFDLDAHLENPGFSGNHFADTLNALGPEFELKLLFSELTARYVTERPFSGYQRRTTQEDGRVLITATVRNNRELLSELFNFADDVEVVAPLALRKYFRDIIRNLACRYQV